jgi:hypothetical protein
VGRAQEKAPVFRTEERRNPTTGATYPWIVPTTAMVNHFYIYASRRLRPVLQRKRRPPRAETGTYLVTMCDSP